MFAETFFFFFFFFLKSSKEKKYAQVVFKGENFGHVIEHHPMFALNQFVSNLV